MKEPLIKSLILFASMFFVAHGITQFFMVDYMDYLEKQRNQISLMSVVTRHHGDELEKKMPELVERMARNCNRTFGELERDADDLAGFIAASVFLLFILYRGRQLYVSGKWPFVRYDICREKESWFRKFLPLCGAVVASVICYVSITVVSGYVLKSLPWPPALYFDAQNASSKLSFVLSVLDQILEISGWLNMLYYLSVVFVALAAAVLLLSKIRCKSCDWIESGCCHEPKSI